jgi:hypothetical protein
MTKKQKIWLGVFLAMFIIPEVLWSPVGNVLYQLVQSGGVIYPFRDNFLMDNDNLFIYRFINTIQLIGLGASLYYICRIIKTELKLVKTVIIFFVIILILINIITLYLSFAFSNIGF